VGGGGGGGPPPTGDGGDGMGEFWWGEWRDGDLSNHGNPAGTGKGNFGVERGRWDGGVGLLFFQGVSRVEKGRWGGVFNTVKVTGG